MCVCVFSTPQTPLEAEEQARLGSLGAVGNLSPYDTTLAEIG